MLHLLLQPSNLGQQRKPIVTFVLIPSFDRMFTDSKPASVIGILTTTFGAHVAIFLASSTISSTVSPITSALTGPSTILHISLIVSSKFLFSFAIIVGFVVIPSTSPKRLIRLISSMFAVSK